MQKGQVTLFIILGLILFFAATLVMYYRLLPLFRERFTPYIEEVPQEVLPVKEYVMQCLARITKQAITQLAKNGGMMNTSSLLVNPSPTESTALQVTEHWIVPYWWYLASPNSCQQDCRFATFVPTLQKEGNPLLSAETQLEQFLENELSICTLSTFPGMTILASPPRLDVAITDDAVHVNAFYPLEVTVQGKIHELSKFYVKQDVKLPALYATAEAVTQQQAQQRFLEMQAMELVTVHSGLDAKKLPPVSETVFTAKPLFWVTANVKELVQQVLTAYIPLLRIRGTPNALRKKTNPALPYNAVINSFYESFLIPLHKTVSSAIHFQYFGWPIYFSLNDKGGIFMPEQAAPAVLPVPLAVQRYSAVYDFSFPVLVETYDKTAFHGAGLSFFFALEGNVRANGPMNVTTDQLEAVAGEEGMLCEQHNTKNTTLFVHDELGKPLSDVVLTFSAGDTCFLGETDKHGKVIISLPVAIGILSAVSPSGIMHSIPLTVYLDEETTEEVVLPSVGIVSISMKTKQLLPHPWRLGAEGLPGENETILVTFERHQESGDGTFTSAAHFSQEKTMEKKELATGTYTVRVMVLQERNITLFPQTQCTSDFPALQQCITIPEQPLALAAPPVMIEVPLTITREDLKKTIILYAPSPAYHLVHHYDQLFVDPLGIDTFTPKK